MKRNLARRILKAGIKAALIYIVYFIFMLLIQPFFEFIGQYSLLIDMFFTVLIVFIFLTELFSGTIIKYMIEFSKSLFIIFYFVAALNSGIIDVSMENVSIIVNLRFFLLMLVLINVIGMAKTVLSAVNFLHEKSEKEY